jgi:Xaa-Pro dipeptidase
MTLADRTDGLRRTMRERDWDLLVCALPKNVLMLSGYWPIIGTAVVCVDREGYVQLLAPQDEEELARKGWANAVATFEPGSLNSLDGAAQSIVGPLARLVRRTPLRVAYESADASEPSSYAAMHLYGSSMPALLSAAFPQAVPEPADEVLGRLRAVKTDDEIARIRIACQTAARAFEEGVRYLQPGIEETHAARNFRRNLTCAATDRADGFVACMSGGNSGRAFGAFARSTHKRIEPGDLVLTHCNSYADGYWTDITRTYLAGAEPNERQRAMYGAIGSAHRAALAAIVPGAAACEVDRAARETLSRYGFGEQFKHSTGHGVGFGAIDAHALPRIHPQSPDRLETGMVFNVEPGIYFPEYGGMRHCDMVAVTSTGAELLTAFQPIEGSE